MKQIHLPNKIVTLVETAHVSRQSVLDVQATIQEIKPDCICIELDQQRAESMDKKQDLSTMKLIDVIKQKKVVLVVVNYILAQYQKKMADNMETNVGDEMRAGITLATQNNTPLAYIDRNIQTTFKRIWSFLSLWEKGKLCVSFITSMFDDETISEEDILHLKQADVLNDALKEITAEFPTVARILVTERDQYMAQKIKDAPGKNVVAIIGAAHANGITHYLQQPDLNPADLEIIKPAAWFSKLIKWLIPLGLVLAVCFTFGIEVLGWWMLAVAIAAAFGAIICLAHPMTILVSFITAPISTLNPLLAVGWFAGLSEAYFRAPTVEDFNNLNTDIKSIKKVLKNNILRTLIVMVMTSLASSLVTLFISLDVIKNLLVNLF